MQAYRVETMLHQGGRLTLDNLPFQKGENVEILIFRQTRPSSHEPSDSLRGMLLEYIDPMEPVALDDWESLT